MTIWAVVATFICIVLIILFIAYRRQVEKTCRHLAFIKGHKTNHRIRSGLPFKELNELADNINDLLDESVKLKQETLKEEKNLKSAITNISHDIRTPLTSLDGYFQLLSKADSEEERSQYLAIIRGRIRSLKNMLEELFTYTKLQNESYSFSIEIIDFKKCVCNTLFSFYNEFKNKQIEPVIDICEEQVCMNGNQEAVCRIVQNLIKNVLEHGCKEVCIKLKVVDDQVIFLCENKMENSNGIDIDQIFSQFYKADLARTHSSTGLGLAIAKGLTERMGGQILAELDGDWFRLKTQFPNLKIVS